VSINRFIFARTANELAVTSVPLGCRQREPLYERRQNFAIYLGPAENAKKSCHRGSMGQSDGDLAGTVAVE